MATSQPTPRLARRQEDRLCKYGSLCAPGQAIASHDHPTGARVPIYEVWGRAHHLSLTMSKWSPTGS